MAGAFGFLAYIILGVVVVIAFGVFAYSRLLASSQDAKRAELAKAEAAINLSVVEDFVRLNNRLKSGETLLENHVALSNFFALLNTLTPSTVRFSALHLQLGRGLTVQLDGTGYARSFNALAVVSAAFAADGRIKDAVFSSIVVNPKDGSVSFKLNAALDPKIVAFTAAAPAADVSAPAAPEPTVSPETVTTPSP